MCFFVNRGWGFIDGFTMEGRRFIEPLARGMREEGRIVRTFIVAAWWTFTLVRTLTDYDR